ncbi:MAG: RHS repeat-associated core domain-containing protein [Thermodesulfobacteriota bacterium]
MTGAAKRYFGVLLLAIFMLTSHVYAGDRTVFGPKELAVGKWHFHASIHRFKADDSGSGLVILTKNTPDTTIRGGFILFNRTFIRLSSFFRGGQITLNKEISLGTKNTLVIFFQGTPEASISLEVREKGVLPPPEAAFSAEPQEIKQGGSSTLAWTTANADSVVIDPGIGPVSQSGSRIVSPQETTVYTLTAAGAGGATTESVAVTVRVPPTVSMSADPHTIAAGEASTLTWSTTNAESCIIEPDIGAVNPNGSIDAAPHETTTYTLTAVGSGGSATHSIQIGVIQPPDDIDYGLHEDEQQGGGGLIGEAIRILNGNCVEYREDIHFGSPNSLGFSCTAFYNSKSDFSGSLGYGWTHTYEVSLDPSFKIGGKSFMRIVCCTGKAYYFLAEEGGMFRGVFHERSYVTIESGNYVWHRLDGARYGFSATGKLIWIEDEKENRLELTYNAQDRLSTVTDTASGRVFAFYYTVDGLLESITGPVTDAVPDGTWVRYGHDPHCNLTSVSYLDGSGFDYAYNDTNDMHNLTEKSNKSGHLCNTWMYDNEDRCVTKFTTHGEGVNVAYVSEGRVDVTDAYGTLRTYTLGKIDGRKRVTMLDGPGVAPYTDNRAIRWEYDNHMRLTEVEYAGGTINQYQDYDDRGNPGKVVLAAGSPEERIIEYNYHPDMNVEISRVERSVLGGGDKMTTWDYDNDYDAVPNEAPSRLLSRYIEQGYTVDASGGVVPYTYITTFTYNSRGQAVTIDGPLPGTDDTTAFAYDAAAGNLLSITRPVIGDTFFSNYDAAGNPGRVTDVNGQSKSISYDGRGRIIEIANDADGSSTAFVYNLAGRISSITDPDGITHLFSYDTDYGRLIRVTDPKNNYVAYGYDTKGNRVEMSYYDFTGNRTFWKRWSYDQPIVPGKLWKEINPDATFTDYGYDSAGNMVSMINPSGNMTAYEYDCLNRLVEIIEPGDVVTSYEYNTQGRVSVIIDAEGHRTDFEYDDMGRLVSTTSPDTGTFIYSYDESGRPIQRIDASDMRVTYSYDALNRLTASHFPDPDQDILYSYDSGPYGAGKLTGVADPAGSIAIEYDAKGMPIRKTSTISGISYTDTYTYTPGNRLHAVSYPTGTNIIYERTSTGKVAGVSVSHNGNSTSLLENIKYLPFGPAHSLEIGSSAASTGYDELYRMTVANSGEDTERTYTYDGNGNISSIGVTNEPWRDQKFSYNELNRLIRAQGTYGTISYTYDKVGNRLTKNVDDEKTDIYNYIPGTNKIDEISRSEPLPFAYDANGNTIAIGSKTYIYNQNNRLVGSEENGVAVGEYIYNGLGQRVFKRANGAATIYHYDLDGNIIGESLSDGTFISEYVYLDGARLAYINGSDNTVYHYLNDHLGTPQFITDSSGTVVWGGITRPFGEANVNPNSSIVNNFRLPGQYFDAETGLHYNYFRDYHPGIGRYMEPDPIGLKGGIALYAYGFNDPINTIDPSGQFGVAGMVIGGIAGVWGGFVAGAQAGNVWAGVVGGVAGGVIGGAVGIIFPEVSPYVGGVVGGFVGGAVGGGVSKSLRYPGSTVKDRLVAMGKGAGFGAVVGGIGGAVGGAAMSIGSTGPAVEIAKEVITTPIGMCFSVFGTFMDSSGQGGQVPPAMCWPDEVIVPDYWYRLPDNSIYSSSEEVDPSDYVEVWVDSGGLGCPPYSWRVSGKGFHFNTISGPTTALTDADMAVLQLWADDTACGSAAIDVADSCGQTGTGYVKSTAGTWVQIHSEYCGTVVHQPAQCECRRCSTAVIGGYKYKDCWWGGTRNWRYSGPTCGKWPYTEDQSGTCCYCAGYYPCFDVVGLYDHHMWEWQCD